MKERRYLGITVTASNYREILEKEGRNGINFHTKHLRAYLKGKTTFTHRWQRDEKGNVVRDSFNRPVWAEYKVQEEWIEK